MIIWIILGILLLLIIVILFSSKSRKVLTDFAQSKPVRALAVKFGDAVLKPQIIAQCKKLNSYLTIAQINQLDKSLTKVMKAWENGRPIKPMLRSIVALAIPYGDYIFDLIEEFTKYDFAGASAATSTSPPVIDSKPVDSKVDDELIYLLGCKMESVKRLSLPARVALLSALKSNPICGITLEELLTQGKMVPNVALIVRIDNRQNTHVYLYKKDALDRWFEGSRVNPMTREPVAEYISIS